MSDKFILFISFILGVIEGMTEFLPISSTGHIILIENFFNYIDDTRYVFIVVIQLGAVSAVLVTFRRRLYNIARHYIYSFFYRPHQVNSYLSMEHILVGTAPGILVGFMLYEKIRLLFYNPIYIVYGLVFGSILLLISEWYFSSLSLRCVTTSVDDITYCQAFLVGCFQCLAFWPGFSRFGATIGGGLLMGLTRQAASEFSFFLSVPIILGSTVLIVCRQKINIDAIHIIVVIIGFLSAFITALMTMKFFLKIVQNISLIPFVIYRCLLATIIYYCI